MGSALNGLNTQKNASRRAQPGLVTASQCIQKRINNPHHEGKENQISTEHGGDDDNDMM
jgi:hypothetical protein